MGEKALEGSFTLHAYRSWNGRLKQVKFIQTTLSQISATPESSAGRALGANKQTQVRSVSRSPVPLIGTDST
ncbi:hypothetical protein RRG08_046700 [Elysia crispata]|uniref:Uncharacterized protein n=1 Tax=Elysia crispata TaxID=231223 RepID=A0AAE1AAI9_9GAST|nr:hypothetical protein RRG08_046700 [Elysia crispata]